MRCSVRVRVKVRSWLAVAVWVEELLRFSFSAINLLSRRLQKVKNPVSQPHQVTGPRIWRTTEWERTIATEQLSSNHNELLNME